MNIFNIVFLLFSFHMVKSTKIDKQILKCLVCQRSIEELSKAVSKLDPNKLVDVGGYRLDVDGNYERKTVPQSKSEMQLSELIENICDKMDDYVRGTWKSNGTLTVFNILSEGGGMNPIMSEVDLIQDDDLNKSLKYYCGTIMEEFEEEIIKIYQNEAENVIDDVCQDLTQLCNESGKTNLPNEEL